MTWYSKWPGLSHMSVLNVSRVYPLELYVLKVGEEGSPRGLTELGAGLGCKAGKNWW